MRTREEIREDQDRLVDQWRYIGDGVYVSWDGWGYWLHANSHSEPTDKIYLEAGVLDGINALRAEVRELLFEESLLEGGRGGENG